MTQLRKRAIADLVIWGIMLAVFIPLFFINGGAETYTEQSTRRSISNICIASAYILHAIMLYLTRMNKEKKQNLRDERDDKIMKESNNIALTGTLIYVFLVCTSLWEKYQTTGNVPVGYMWFLAYSTIGFSFFFTSLVTMIVDWKNSANAES